MIKILITGIAVMIGTAVSIYTFNIPTVDNGMISFNNYKGKKILIVNTASESAQAPQLAELQQLYTANQDSLVVIAFPSNSFGNEPRKGAALKHWKDSLGLTFPVIDVSDVTGPSGNMLFRWLAHKSYNGITDAKTVTDFQKFLIGKTGNIVGIFDSSVSPIGSHMQTAIHNTN